MLFSLIAAVAKTIVLKNNKFPECSEDFNILKMTLGKTCLMGQATFESILGYLGKPLPGRQTVVLTLNKNYTVPEGVRVFHSLEDAFEKLKDEDVFICGGASIYRQTINHCDTLDITEIHHSPAGETFFTDIDKNVWKEVAREDNSCFSFVTYKK